MEQRISHLTVSLLVQSHTQERFACRLCVWDRLHNRDLERSNAYPLSASEALEGIQYSIYPQKWCLIYNQLS